MVINETNEFFIDLLLKPKISNNVEILVKEDGFYGYVRIADGTIKIVNKTGLEVLNLCNGKHTVSEIITHVSKKYAQDESKIRESILRFIYQCYRLGLIEW